MIEKKVFCRLLCDTVINFQSNQEEVSLIVSPEKITFKNYVDDEPGNRFFFLTYFFVKRKEKKMKRFSTEKCFVTNACMQMQSSLCLVPKRL